MDRRELDPIEMGNLQLVGMESTAWLGKVEVSVREDGLLVEVVQAGAPDSDEWEPSVQLHVHSDGRFTFQG